MVDNKDEKEVKEINLLDYFIVLLKHIKLIIGITSCVALITAIISLIIPPIYRAETTILPPTSSISPARALLSQLTEISMGGLPGLKRPSDLYAALLKSNTVLDRIIDRFKLMELYGVEKRLDARKKLLKNIRVSVDPKSEIIKLEVEDKDPERAAQIANAFVEELINLTRGLAISENSQMRLYLEEELKNQKLSLIKAEEEFKKFQQKTGALKIEAQAQAVIESIANLRAQIAAKEVELKVMRTYSTSNNPDLKRAEEALKAMRAELKKFEEKGSPKPEPLIPTGSMPEIQVEYLRKLRDLKFHETLYEQLLKAYEAVRIRESQEPVVIQVVDKAIPPDKRAKPKRKEMVMVATLIGFLFSVFMSFIVEYKDRALQDPESRKKLEFIKESFKFRIKLRNFFKNK